jgi:hypothetical protein
VISNSVENERKKIDARSYELKGEVDDSIIKQMSESMIAFTHEENL